MLSFVSASLALAPGAPVVQQSRVAARSNTCVMETSSRRELFAKGAAMLAGAAFVEGASAKAGQFGKLGLFDMEDISSPYVPGGPKSGPESTYGYKKTEGEILANGYQADVDREKAAFLESSKRILSLQPKIDSKTWWFVRDELRIQAYNMRSSMLALNGVLSDAKKPEVAKLYKKFWSEVEQFDLACKKKEPALAQKEYGDVKAALAAYTAAIGA